MAENVIGEAFVAIRPTGQEQFKSETTSTIKSIALSAGAVFGALKIGQFLGGTFRSFIDEAREAQKVSGQTAAVIKSTGQAAGLTAKDIDQLASAQSEKVAVDDELIKSGANVLLTFTKVRDEAGKGNDVFSQGVKVALDMSAALGQDLQASIVQVGKALNDPVEGVTALRRVGVQLTDQQKESISAFVAQNNILGAQKVILKELRTEFGGSAAAIATDADRFQVTLKNFEENAGKALLPFVDGFLQAGVAILGFIDSLGGLVQIAPAVAVAIGLIGLAMDSALGPLGIAVGAAGILVQFANKLGLIGSQSEDTSDHVSDLAAGILKANSALGAASAFDAFNKDLDGVAKKFGAATREGSNFYRLAAESPTAARLVIDGLKAQGRETDLYEKLLGRAITKQNESTEAVKAAAAENRALLSTIDDLNAAVLKASGTQAGYEQAIVDVNKAERDVLVAIHDHGIDSEEARDATLRRTQAQLSAVGAAQALDEANQLLNETIGGSPEKIQAEIDKLNEAKRLHPEVASSYDPIIGRLVDMKRKLDELPKEVPITVRLEGVEVTQQQLATIQGQINTLITSGGQGIPVPGAYSGPQNYQPEDRYDIDGNYIGTWAKGGTIPGPVGKPWLATVHGGEEIIPAGMSGGDNYQINFYDHRGGSTEAAVEIVRRHRLAQALR